MQTYWNKIKLHAKIDSVAEQMSLHVYGAGHDEQTVMPVFSYTFYHYTSYYTLHQVCFDLILKNNVTLK